MNHSRPFSKRGAYTESNNTPAWNRVWPRETTVFPSIILEICVCCVLQLIHLMLLRLVPNAVLVVNFVEYKFCVM